MNWHPYDIENEIEIYYEQWREDYEFTPEELTKSQIKKIVKLLNKHDQRDQIYKDLEAWFNNMSEREDVMSDTLMLILEEIFTTLFTTEEIELN